MFIRKRELKRQISELEDRILSLAYEVEGADAEENLDEVTIGFDWKINQYYVTTSGGLVHHAEDLEEALDIFYALCEQQYI